MANRTEESPPLAITIEEGATRLGIHPLTFRRMVARGVIDSFKIGRRRLVPVGAIERYIDSQVEVNRRRISDASS